MLHTMEISHLMVMMMFPSHPQYADKQTKPVWDPWRVCYQVGWSLYFYMGDTFDRASNMLAKSIEFDCMGFKVKDHFCRGSSHPRVAASILPSDLGIIYLNDIMGQSNCTTNLACKINQRDNALQPACMQHSLASWFTLCSYHIGKNAKGQESHRKEWHNQYGCIFMAIELGYIGIRVEISSPLWLETLN